MPISGSNKTEYQRDYMRKKRSKGLTGSNELTHIDTVQDAEFAVKCLTNKPITSDIEARAVQLLPPERVQLIRGILADRRNAGLFDDSVDRWQRAVDYREWELEK